MYDIKVLKVECFELTLLFLFKVFLGLEGWLSGYAIAEDQAQFPPSTQRLTTICNPCSRGLWCILVSTSTRDIHGCRYSTQTHKASKSKRKKNLLSPTCFLSYSFSSMIMQFRIGMTQNWFIRHRSRKQYFHDNLSINAMHQNYIPDNFRIQKKKKKKR